MVMMSWKFMIAQPDGKVTFSVEVGLFFAQLSRRWRCNDDGWIEGPGHCRTWIRSANLESVQHWLFVILH